MMPMTSVERVRNILARKPVDRIGVFEHFWGDTVARWTAEGRIHDGESLEDHFSHDIRLCWPFDFTARLGFTPEVIEETNETVLARDGNGALLRRYKTHEGTPEHVDFLVKDRAGWEEHIKPLITADRARVNFQAYREARRAARDQNRFFAWCGTNVFELMHPVCGHQHMLTGMVLDPDWIRDMVETFSRVTVELWEILFAEEGAPDGIWFYEDMGFKKRPFMSPDMYRELILPGHRRTVGWAKERGLPVIMHSCGYVEPLLPGMIEAGIDCLQVIEVKAGMDLLKLYRQFGDRLSFMGGMDVRVLYSNNLEAVNRELSAKIPVVKENYGYILHSDHSIPNTVSYDTYRYFVDRGLELGSYA